MALEGVTRDMRTGRFKRRDSIIGMKAKLFISSRERFIRVEIIEINEGNTLVKVVEYEGDRKGQLNEMVEVGELMLLSGDFILVVDQV